METEWTLLLPLFIESGSPASRANPRLVPSGWQPLNC